MANMNDWGSHAVAVEVAQVLVHAAAAAAAAAS